MSPDSGLRFDSKEYRLLSKRRRGPSHPLRGSSPQGEQMGALVSSPWGVVAATPREWGRATVSEPKLTVERAKALRRVLTPPEARLWTSLRLRPGGLKFRRRHPLGPFILDFYCEAARLAAEVDGEGHASATIPSATRAATRGLTDGEGWCCASSRRRFASTSTACSTGSSTRLCDAFSRSAAPLRRLRRHLSRGRGDQRSSSPTRSGWRGVGARSARLAPPAGPRDSGVRGRRRCGCRVRRGGVTSGRSIRSRRAGSRRP